MSVFRNSPRYQPPSPKKELDPIAVTAYLRDLVIAFVSAANESSTIAQADKEYKAINDCFRLLLGRGPTEDEIRRITPW